MSITPEQAAALRKPFPREAIGILPKPYKADSPKGKCSVCDGYHGLPAVHLDYVGHAAVTDRLLSVDPGWTWEPLAVTPEGLPQLDRGGNLWIRLTVGGVTRLGVGDGKSAKELIGDAIRNAAMRFGVALDLWSKEELEGVDEHVARPTDAAPQDTSARPRPPAAQPAPTPEPAASDAPAGALTQRTRGRLFALLTEQGITDEAVQRQGMAVILDRPIASRADLTEADARQIIASLEARQ